MLSPVLPVKRIRFSGVLARFQDVTVRTGTAQDVSVVLAFNRRILTQEFGFILKQKGILVDSVLEKAHPPAEVTFPLDAFTVAEDLADLNSAVRLGGLYVVEHDKTGEMIGSGALMGRHYNHGQSDTAYLGRMYLLSPYRGRGIGQWLLNTLLSQAKALGYKTVKLTTHTSFTSAMSLYAKHGFVLSAGQPYQRFMVMEKSL